MALEIFDGLPGAGKTFSSMYLRILPHLAAGGYVVTNVEVKPEGVGAFIKERYGKIWNPDRLKLISDDDCVNFFRHLPKGSPDCPVLCVLDEVHLWFNARDWAKNDAKARETFEMATQHRKFHLDIVMISQHLSNIDAQFLKLVAGLSRFRDLKKWHPPGLPFIRIPFFRFLALHYDKTGRNVIKRDWMRPDLLVFASYNTLAVLKGGEAMAGAEVIERVKLAADPVTAAKMAKVRKVLKWGSALVVLSLIGWYLRKAYGAPAAVAAPVAAVKSPPAPVVVQRAPDPVREALPPKTFMEAPPVVECLPCYAVGGWLNPKVLIELDGARQWLTAGSEFSRGRVGTVRRLGSVQLHEVSFWDDEGKRRRFRVNLVHRPAGLQESAARLTYKPPGSPGTGPVVGPDLQPALP